MLVTGKWGCGKSYLIKNLANKINAEENKQLAAKYNVNAFPTFLIFKNGDEVERFSGYKQKEDLMNRIMNHLA